MKTIHTKQRGVTLIELMLAMAIGLIIMLGVGTVYSNSKKTYRVQEEFSRMQENGRFALEYIARFVRGAGYAGCASGLSAVTNDLNDPDALEWGFSTGIEGYEAQNTGPNESFTLDASPTYTANQSASTWTTSGGTTLAATTSNNNNSFFVAEHSDVLVSRSADGNGVELKESHPSANLEMYLVSEEANACPGNKPKLSGLCPGDVVMLSDCKKSVVFQATNVTKNGSGSSATARVVHSAGSSPGNNTTAWGTPTPGEERDFEQGAEMMKVSSKAFYVGQGVNGPALFMKQGNGAGQEIIDGVESLQVLYGEDTDSTPDNIPNRFVTADNVADFADVVALKVSILLTSSTDLAHRPTGAQFHTLTGHSTATGVSITSPSDQRMRRVMSMVIKLRNRGFTI